MSQSHSTSLPFPIPISAVQPGKRDLLLWKREGEMRKTTFTEEGKAVILSKLVWRLKEYCLAKVHYMPSTYNNDGKFRASLQKRFVFKLKTLYKKCTRNITKNVSASFS